MGVVSLESALLLPRQFLTGYHSTMGTPGDLFSMDAFVFEPTSLWTAELERAFAGQNLVKFRWHPHRKDFLANADVPRLAILAVSADDDSIELITQLRQANPSAGIICLVKEDDHDWEALARECGATAVLPDVTQKSEVIALVRRMLIRDRLVTRASRS